MLKSYLCCICLVCLSVTYSYSSTKLDRSYIHFDDLLTVQDTAKKPNLLKSLLEAIKFRKKAITKEQERVQIIIEKMIAKNSSLATIQDLEKLRDDISLANKLQFDTLLALIKEIRIPDDNNITVQSENSPIQNKPFKINKELDPNDKYINDLVDRLVPILTNNKEDQEREKGKQERLNLMRVIYSDKNTFIDTINDSTVISYRLKLNHKAEVLANHRFDATYSTNKYNLSNLSTLIYNYYEADPATGLSINMNKWRDASIVSKVKDLGGKVVLTRTTKNSLETAKLLTNGTARSNLINNTINLLEQRDGDGVNISLTGLNSKLRSQFTDFINSLSSTLRSKSKEYQVIITIPVYDEVKAYNIMALDTLVDRFIIDFSKKPNDFPGPIAPLTDESDYNIQSSVSRYLNIGIPPYKFILGLSYYGVNFERNPNTGIEKFKEYIPYNLIRLNHQYAPVNYNKDQAFASIETRDDDGNLTGHIYYDNENSLEQKYDFIIQNGLGGVAIQELGADEGYGELWDALAYKFISIDTVAQETISLKPAKIKDATIWGYVKSNTIYYYYALQYPCDIRFDHPDTLLLTIVNIFLALISLLALAILIYQIKDKGEKWRWKKTLIKVLIISINLFIITIFMWLYIDNSFPWFGAGENCISMPFLVLLMIIFTGILFGSLIMRFLIFPAIQHDEKP